MADEALNEPALALAIYASTAATTAIQVLQQMGLIHQSTVNLLIENLTRCRQLAGTNPVLIEHTEILTDMLLKPFPQQGEPGSR